MLVPFRADHVFLGQNLIDLRHGEPDLMFPFQKIGDRLAAALVLADAQFPDQPFDHWGDLPGSSGALLGLRMAREKPGQPVRGNPFEPEPDGLPVSSQMRRNLRVTQALGSELPGQRDLGLCLHVHRLLWTVGYLRQHCEGLL